MSTPTCSRVSNCSRQTRRSLRSPSRGSRRGGVRSSARPRGRGSCGRCRRCRLSVPRELVRAGCCGSRCGDPCAVTDHGPALARRPPPGRFSPPTQITPDLRTAIAPRIAYHEDLGDEFERPRARGSRSSSSGCDEPPATVTLRAASLPTAARAAAQAARRYPSTRRNFAGVCRFRVADSGQPAGGEAENPRNSCNPPS